MDNLMPTAAAHRLPITVVTSPGGITAWLVEDHMVPVISFQFAFRGGSALDPLGKAGLANLAAATLDEGAGDMRAEDFHQALEDQSIYLSYSASRDEFRGGVKTLTVNTDEAMRLLALSLIQPRFDDAEIERVKSQIISDIQHNYSDTQWVAHRTMNSTIFAGHPYRFPGAGFEQTVEKLTRQDLVAWTRARMAKDNLLVAVSGDISPEQLAPLLDQVFGGLPAQSQPFQLPPVTLAAVGKNFVVTRKLPQTRILMVQHGIPRSDPDWYAATILNYSLGGGGFNSRLMMEVREKRGLTYGVSTQLQHNKSSNLMLVGAATANATAAECVRIIKEEWQKLADGGITADELQNAQTYLTGALPLALTSTDKIADFILQLQIEKLGLDYPAERLAKLRAVTMADVARTAKKLLHTHAMTLIAVGEPENLLDAEVLPDPAKVSGA